MITLAFDTSAGACAAALLIGDEVTPRIDQMARGQAEHLMVMLEEMLRGAGLGWADLTAIGVGTGPGNFTGIRISVAAARGLALGLSIPAVGVSVFETTGYGMPTPHWASLNAPRDQAYLCRSGGTPALVSTTPLPDLDAPLIRAEERSETAHIEALVRIAASRASTVPLPRPAPLYIRPADAAPARDAPPLIVG